uniref:Uncharacterized protein n=1 Tax=Rhodnius prolixus TaxID=13249 RepID=T1I7D8_RHOPR
MKFSSEILDHSVLSDIALCACWYFVVHPFVASRLPGGIVYQSCMRTDDGRDRNQHIAQQLSAVAFGNRSRLYYRVLFRFLI